MKNKSLKLFAVSTLASLVGTFVAEEIRASFGNISEKPDYLLILGCTVHGDEPCETLKTRINAAAKFLLAHPTVTAMPCGGIVQKDQTKAEAEVIADELIKMGVAKERIILENKSTTTVENFVFAKKLIEEHSENKQVKIAFLSSEYHLLRASIIAKKAGVKAQTVPAKTPKNEIVKAYLREFIVFPSAF